VHEKEMETARVLFICWYVMFFRMLKKNTKNKKRQRQCALYSYVGTSGLFVRSCVCACKQERERESERESKRERERENEKVRDRERERGKEKEGGREREREREGGREGERERARLNERV